MSRHISVYRRMLLVYPTAFRDAYGEEMVRLFEDLLADARRPRQRLGVLRLWLITLVDLLASATRQRMENTMNNHPALTRAILVAVPVGALASLFFIGVAAGLFALALGMAVLAAHWGSLGAALGEPRRRRWWVAPLLGLALVAAGVGVTQLPAGSEDVRWGLGSLMGFSGVLTALWSVLLSVISIVRRPPAPSAS